MTLFHCRSAATSLQGRRPSNQDAVLDTRLADGRHLVAVADGMGGHRSGEVASAMALEVLVRELRAGRTLHDAVVEANAEVFRQANLDLSRAGMGTTLVALLRTNAVYEIANVGDSRAYRIDSHGIHRISVDHSFAEEAASRALMGPDEIARSPWRNALTRSLGTQDTIEVDVFGPFEIAGRPHTVMLCSDGLYRALSDEAAWHHLAGAPDPTTGARALADLALRHGSDDNISVAVVQFEGAPAAAHTGRAAPVARAQGAYPVEPPERRGVALASAPSPQASQARPMRLAPRPSLLRRTMAAAFSDNVLFGLCTGILVMWLALRLIQG
ncbi:MAG TPA: protein phosphatase 2C domain-containing protein [Longimicrobiaceae bacterium]